MFDAEVRAISLFFFFALLDDKRSMAAAAKATDLFFHRMKISPQTKPAVAVVTVTRQIWEKSRGNFFRGRPNFSADSGWLIADGLDLSPWKEFQKGSPEDEMLALIWSQILKIKDEDISVALGLTEGTLRYRVGRALRKLGGMTQLSVRKLEAVRT